MDYGLYQTKIKEVGMGEREHGSNSYEKMGVRE